jgi:hypothetical protein
MFLGPKKAAQEETALYLSPGPGMSITDIAAILTAQEGRRHTEEDKAKRLHTNRIGAPRTTLLPINGIKFLNLGHLRAGLLLWTLYVSLLIYKSYIVCRVKFVKKQTLLKIFKRLHILFHKKYVYALNDL